MSALVTWISGLPRAARWAALAAVVFGGYFLVVEPVLEQTNRLSAQADVIERNLRRASELGSDDSDEGRVIANGLRAFGTPRAPVVADGVDRGGSVQRIVDGILASHGVNNASRTERSAQLTGDRARELAPDGKIQREMVEVSFEADQRVVAAVIADLERSSGISAVSRVKLDRTSVGNRFAEQSGASPGTVRASLTAEAWVFVRSGGSAASTGGLP